MERCPSYWNDLSHHVGSIQELFWLSHPLVRDRVYRRISGDIRFGAIHWLAGYLASETPLERCVSIGCGTGGLERELVANGIVTRIVGVDVEDEPLAYARRERDTAGIGADRIDYVKTDARDFLSRQSGLDGVFFRGSLHHMDRLDDMMARVSKALRTGGLLYADEYVGPSMHQWNWRTLFLANLFHNLLSWKVRRVGIIRAPRNPDDPTEMICSSEILPAIRRHFVVETRRDYGGNLVALIYANLQRPSADRAHPTQQEFDRAIEFLLDSEDRLTRTARLRSHHSIVVARPR